MSQGHIVFEIQDKVMTSVLLKARDMYLRDPEQGGFHLVRSERQRLADSLAYWGILNYLGSTVWALTKFSLSCTWHSCAGGTLIIELPLEEE